MMPLGPYAAPLALLRNLWQYPRSLGQEGIGAMMTFAKILVTAAGAAALAVPAAAQYPYPPQPYPYPGQGYPGQTYPGQPYPGQPYGGTGVVGNIIDQLLGNRYNVTDRGAVRRCADAALQQAQYQYQGNNPYGYQQYNYNYGMRVAAITEVERRSSGLRVSGLIDSGLYYGQYGNQYWNQGYGNANYGDLRFRCTVDYRGYVSNVRVRRNDTWRRPF
jgi:hypothetical protein